jgi:Fe-S cluster assembly protein SufD
MNDGFTALNTALIHQGLFLEVAADVCMVEPVQFLNVFVDHDEEMIHPRNLIIAGSNASMTLVEHHLSLSDGRCWTNGVTDVVLGGGSKYHHYFVQNQNEQALHINLLRVRQAADSRFFGHSLLFGGGLVRNSIHVTFEGQGAEAEVNGLYLGRGKQHPDHDVFIDHKVPHCTSVQLFKGILDGEAHGVFNGRVMVRPDAQKTDARQTNRNLLLSDKARIDTKPQLEIYADDVKCAHGTTTGQIDEEALFYLKARGIDPATAMDLLVYAFAHEVLDHLPLDAVREQAERVLYRRFSRATMMEEG